jgi:subtilisin family serine protease
MSARPRRSRGASRSRARKAAAAASFHHATIVYVHGIGAQPPPEELSQSWDRALFGQWQGSATRLAYWADILHAPADADGRTLARRSGPARDGVDPALPPAAQEYVARLEARYGIVEHAEGPRGPRKKILPAPLREPVARWLMKRFIRDTAAYFFDEAKREAIRERLRAQLDPVLGPYVIVAHSQGSIIAYDVLGEARFAGLEVPLLVTIGSPLGLDEVQDHVGQPLRRPRGVAAWTNFADRLDPVALDGDLANDTRPKGDVVDVAVSNSGLNRHEALEYLAQPAVRARIGEVVGSVRARSVGPPVVAKDVIRATDRPHEERYPVLVELMQGDDGSVDDLRKRSATIHTKIVEIVGRVSGASARQAEELAQVDPLLRYVGAKLTAREIDHLAAGHGGREVFRIWRNAKKRALLRESVRTLQADAARGGYGATGEGIHWAVLDTGIDAGHPHFATHENVAAAWNCTVRGTPEPLERKGRNVTKDADGHGTHVAGIIAGTQKDDPHGLTGMAPRTKLHCYKVLDDEGGGHDLWILKGLQHIYDLNESASTLRIHGVNLSLGGSFDPEVYACGHSPICKELRRLWRQGVVVCVAAGNEGSVPVETPDGTLDLQFDLSIGDPANLDEAIAVGSVHKEKPALFGISYFSSRGPTADGRTKPDVVAPGERIVSANAARGRTGESDYVELSGTSMACPHISGLVAAFLSVRTQYLGRPDEVKRILMENCTDLRRDRYHQGAGLPNLTRMLLAT